MDKPTKKRNTYNATAINEVAKKWGVTTRYVRASLDGTRKGIIPDKLKAEYKALDNKLKAALINFKSN